MKQVCVYCQRMAADAHLWCQEKECPAETSPFVFSYGEQLGDLEIVRPITILHSSTVYEARQGRMPVLLKVAHHGYRERLAREASFLLECEPHPVLPVLRSAHQGRLLAKYPYGATAYCGMTWYYAIYDFAPGQTLRTFLLENPEIFYEHAAWITLSLAHVFHHRLHTASEPLVHGALQPEAVLIRFDDEGVPRPLLLDLGMAARVREPGVCVNEYSKIAPQAYLLPVRNDPKGAEGSNMNTFADVYGLDWNGLVDVYGLSLLMHEMLAGRPHGSLGLPPGKAIKRKSLALKRQDLDEELLRSSQDIIQYVQDVSSARANIRIPQTVDELTERIRPYFGDVPVEKLKHPFNWRQFTLWGGILLLLVALLIALALVRAM